MPVSLEDARCTIFDGPPRVVALGFQLSSGKLVGLEGNKPTDLFADAAFDYTRQRAVEIAKYMREHGEFSPALLGPEELEYTTLPQVLEKLKGRFKKSS